MTTTTANADSDSSPLALAGAVLGERARFDVDLGPFCTYRVGGAAAVFVEAHSVSDLEAAAEAVNVSGLPTLVVGRGSNLLVAEKGFPGVVVHLGSEFATIELPDSAEGAAQDLRPARIRAGGAALLPVVARRTARSGLTGFEWAVGVPGSIGGAVRMNAGGHGSDMAASLRSVGLFDLGDGRVHEISVEQLDLGYRHSSVAENQIVLWAELELEWGDAETSALEISEIVGWRRNHQPGGQNAGSVFANPPKESAGRLIDSLGLKGLRIGSAEVSTKHANFIQVDPGGSADDVYSLIRHLQLRVAEASGHELRVENRLIGFGR